MRPDDHDARMARARLSLLGLSIGDSFGECFFAADAKKRIASRRLPDPPWYYTDDTEMALSIVDVLDACGRIDQDRLAASFARRYDPRRGYGSMAGILMREYQAGIRWQDAAPAAFAGQGSMGNGGAMRVPPVGAYFADDLERAAREADLSAEVTHSHREGQAGAIAVAVAAALAWQEGGGPRLPPREFITRAMDETPSGDTCSLLYRASKLRDDVDVAYVAAMLGSGRQVTAPDTVPFVIWCAAHFRDSFEEAMWNTVAGLGDRDTTCAMVGGIVALSVGDAGIPPAWRDAREPLG